MAMHSRRIENQILKDFAIKKLSSDTMSTKYEIVEADANHICIKIKGSHIIPGPYIDKALALIKPDINVQTYVSKDKLLYIYDTSDKQKNEEFLKFKTYMALNELVKVQKDLLEVKTDLLEALKAMKSAGVDMSYLVKKDRDVLEENISLDKEF
jgi:hypothetical protein